MLAAPKQDADLIVSQLLRLRDEDGIADAAQAVCEQVAVLLDHLIDCGRGEQTKDSLKRRQRLRIQYSDQGNKVK